jgi:hypothetical protein
VRVLLPGVSVSGRVVNGEGKPVEGLVRLGLVEEGGRMRNTRLDADGRFVLHRAPPGEHELVVQAEGFAPQFHRVQISGADLDLAFAVTEPARFLRGKVIDPEGQPLGRALVAVEDPNLHSLTISKADGSFEKLLVAPGAMTVLVQHEGYMRAYLPVAAGEHERVFTVHRPLTVRGQILDKRTRKPIDPARLLVQGRRPVDESAWLPVHGAEAGRYEIEFQWTTGTHVLRVEADGYKPVISREIRPEEREVILNFELEADVDAAKAERRSSPQ